MKEFGAPPKRPYLTEVADAIENSGKPVVAAVHGTALGGGFELAMAAHARVAAADTEFGLPEVRLGIVPGAGGTQRLPRLVGIPKAIEFVSSGRRIPAQEAHAVGIVDQLVEENLLGAAVDVARSLLGTEPRRTGSLSLPAFDRAEADRQTAAVERKARGQSSPGHAARLVLLASEMDLRDGLAAERASFLELVSSDQSRALRHVFAAERAAAKVPGLEGVEPRKVESIGVVGAGMMGAGIAVSFLEAGYRVLVVERDEDAAEAGRARIEALYERMRKSGRIDEDALTERRGRIGIFSERSALADCDLVIEAVFDDLAVKQELFAALSLWAPMPSTILPDSTSPGRGASATRLRAIPTNATSSSATGCARRAGSARRRVKATMHTRTAAEPPIQT